MHTSEYLELKEELDSLKQTLNDRTTFSREEAQELLEGAGIR